MKINAEYIGSWLITEMSTWDRNFIDLVVPRHLTVKADGMGTFTFFNERRRKKYITKYYCSTVINHCILFFIVMKILMMLTG